MDNPIESWILESGASFHSSPNKELFQNFKSENFEITYLADNKTLNIEGKWYVYIKTSVGDQWTLKDVRNMLLVSRRTRSLLVSWIAHVVQ